MRRAARVVAGTVVALALVLGGACSTPQLDREGARAFSVEALRASGVREVETVAEATTSACSVEGAAGWRTVTATEVGEVSMCVSRDQGRVLSVRDPGLSDDQFGRLERYRGETAEDRAMPLAIGSALLLLVGTVLTLSLQLPRGRPS